MNNPILPHDRQRVAYREAQNVENFQAIERERRDGRVTVKPFSIWMLAVWGLAFFLAGFFSARPGSNFTATTVDLSIPPASQLAQLAVETSAAPASAVQNTVADANIPVVAQVVMKNMKYSPATIEIKKGDTVEWTNEDITPHTATAPQFDSGSLASDKSWKHTFTIAGRFPYGCTFHPDMKGVVVVR